MKRIISILLLSLIFTGCKKDTPAPTPPPAGPCNCGELLQQNVSTGTVTAKNYCTGNILTFQVGLSWWANPQSEYCQSTQW
jgi:hypothetical protein